MAEMVRSMLDISKMEAGQLKLNRTDCDLGTIAMIFDQFDSCTKTGVSKSVPRRIAYRSWITTSSAACCKIWSETRSNTRPMTAPCGSPCNPPKRWRACLSSTRVRVFHPNITDAFSEIHCRFRKSGPRVGTGLGLTFAGYAHGSPWRTHRVKSEVGKGSTFWFEIPCRRQPGHYFIMPGNRLLETLRENGA